MTLADIFTDGPPVRLLDLATISGLSKRTVSTDVALGALQAFSRDGRGVTMYLVHRREAQRWLIALGFPAHHQPASLAS